MKSRALTCITAMTLFAALIIPVRLAAQEQKKQHTRYKLVDLGTFGGPNSFVPELQQIINSRGAVAGSADTSTPDPYPKFCFNPDCFVSHAFQSQNGVVTDLGALPGVNSSTPAQINARGWVTGMSQNGEIDPLFQGFPEQRAVLWRDNEIIDLGTLGGNESGGIGINDRGQVIGVASNTMPDPFSFFGGTQARAFLWENGVMQDLGTLGGPDAFGQYVNDRGQVTGFSYTSYNPGPRGVPPVDPFLWDHGKMTDLGTLGGTFGQANDLNNRGQVVGTSNLAGDLTFHPFLWTRGVLTDLGTFGGNNGSANWLNDAGDVVGYADFPGNQRWHAFLHRHGVMVDLGTVNGDTCSSSNAISINSKGQVVGGWGACFQTERAFLWDNRGPMVDLNTLVAPGSGLSLTVATFINDRGEIAGNGVLSNGDTHAFLLIPCEDGDKGCGDAAETSAVNQNSPVPATKQPASLTPDNPALNPVLSRRPFPMLDWLRSPWGQRYWLPDAGIGPTNYLRRPKSALQ